MRKKKSFRPFGFFNSHLLKNPVLLGVAIVSFVAGYGLQEVFREPEHPALVQSQEGIICTTCFTPTHQCLSLILRHIQKAQKSIKVQAYSFTSKEIALIF